MPLYSFVEPNFFPNPLTKKGAKGAAQSATAKAAKAFAAKRVETIEDAQQFFADAKKKTGL